MPAVPGEEHVGVIAFERGYIVWGYVSQQPMALVAWYSPDGVTWTRSDLAKTIAACDGTRAGDVAYASIAVTDGRTVALFAQSTLAGTGECPGTSRTVALSTSDGDTWHRSEVGPSGRSFGPAAAWRAAGGWDALIADAGGTGLWHSADLVTWTRLSTVPASSDLMESKGAASGSTRVVATTGREREGAVLVSDDGTSWRTLTSLPKGHGVGGVLAPPIAGASWLVEVGSSSSAEDPATLLTSSDLATWRTGTIPETWATVVALPWGWEAVGVVPYDCLGGNCPPGPASVLYRSTDGVHWSSWGEVPREIPAGGSASWPAEFLVVGNVAGQAVPLWRLTTE